MDQIIQDFTSLPKMLSMLMSINGLAVASFIDRNCRKPCNKKKKSVCQNRAQNCRSFKEKTCGGNSQVPRLVFGETGHS